MKHRAGHCHQGRKPCRCGSPDLPHVPLIVEIAVIVWVVFAIAFAVAFY